MSKHLFGPDGRAALARLCGSKPLLAFDFDGTLCGLHARPGHSRTLRENLGPLRRLCRVTPVAVITGRSVKDVRSRLGFAPKFVVGNHGLEGLGGAAAARAVRTVARWRADLAEVWTPFADDPGVFVEDKGYSLSLHFRLARDPAVAARRLRTFVRNLTPAPRVIGGKFIFNLTVEGTAHKGTALTELMRRTRARHALFVGDDVTDEDAFRVSRAGVVKVRVDRSRKTAADYYVRELAGVTRLLEHLDEALGRS